METNVVILGDCLDVLRELPNNSIDSVVTDPPYGLSKEPNIEEVLTKWLAGEDYSHRGGGFMGKTWDSFVPGPSIWREVYRVLKPGGHALVFAGTRTQDLMTISLRLAGFEIRDVIEWLYFSGFPKSLDVGKQFDKRGGVIANFEEFRDTCLEALKKPGKTRSELQRRLGNYMLSHYLTRGSQPAVPVYRDYVVIRDYLELGDRFDAYFKEEAEREKIGEYEYKRKGDGTWDTESPGGMFGAQERIVDITAPATELAKKWDGWGTALKPSHEPIVVARKPLDGAVAENVERFGTGAINIDGCRIPATPEDIAIQRKRTGGKFGERLDGDVFNSKTSGFKRQPAGNEKDRFPANIVTTEPDAFWSKYCDVTAKTGNVTPEHISKKASKKDRNSDWRGELINLEPKNHMRVNAPRKSEEEKYATKHANNHPTVKPTDLMAWLVRLVTPPGGIVLDPFAGSGTTLVAAKREGFQYIGIEREAEYVEIAKARVG